ncbi:sulfatase [Haloferax sp. Atlit-10N]|uniref:AlkP-core domain protein n=1 Tax=Haloferax gibbonsii TaxID=35746 RepID=A0A871BKC7_HALGI|nr:MULTISPECIES: sulfatase [Haloferax]QOS13587.1 AlkP-core domain protein [Haloferax gibbonsii]RDZ44509.1 sulfatase [Haloferax sp. Atlit-16N]RDZ56318.1 sulfatase [Haloferax sp. Atlit-10N]WEL28093.1 Arylsulfatase A [Haloferax lucentense]
MTERPNIVWITLESTRADHTTMGGYDRNTTPNLQRIADSDDGRYFDQCVSHGIWTLASSASILTATYPSHHGAGMTGDAIPSELPTVAERFQQRGYDTKCISPNSHLSSATGLDRGFNEFVWLSKSTLREAVGIRSILSYIRSIRTHGGGLTLDTRKHGTDYMLNRLALRWLEERQTTSDPLFLYLHYGGPHHPYLPPDRYLEQFAGDRELSLQELKAVGIDHHENLYGHMAENSPFSEEAWEALRALYDGEIAHADELVGELFDAAQSLDIDDTVFVITADHGELFGESGLLAHQIVTNDAVSHVPLVTHGLEPALTHGGELVQHADVMTTLLGLTGCSTDGTQGIDLRTGRRDFAIVQRGADRCRQNVSKLVELNPNFDASRFPDSTLTGLRTMEFRYEHSAAGTELFRLPDETSDLSNDYPAVVADLDAKLHEWFETQGTPVTERRQEGRFTDEMRAQLADLGYLVD